MHDDIPPPAADPMAGAYPDPAGAGDAGARPHDDSAPDPAAVPAPPAAAAAQGLPAPCNIEAEQAVLGALLVNNEVFDRIASIIEPHHFYDPVHQRIYELIASRVNKGMLATPVTLKAFIEQDEGIREIGGAEYLLRLAGAAVSVSAAPDYARTIHDLAVRRDLIRIGEEIRWKAARMDLETEPREQIVEAEQALYALAEKGKYEGGFKSFLSASIEAIHVANQAYQRDGGLAGIPTGLIDLDRKLGGLHPSDLLILAGRPSMGKTTLATNIAFNVARAFREGERPDGTFGTIDGGKVGFFSLEMSAEQLATRILSEAARVPSEKIRRGDMEEEEFQRLVDASRELERMPLYIDDTPALPISTLAARARRLKRQHGLDLLVIDYLQLVRPASAKDSRVNEVSEITQGLKAIAKELNIPVIALSQLSRQVEAREDKRPQLSDLRESGSIEQDADVVMFVFREEYYKEREKPSEHDVEAMMKWQEVMERVAGKAEVIIGKQRHGPIGTVELAFEGRFTRFGNLARPEQAPDGGF
ncbi:replicative DNA helicase [Oceanicella actignis]|uniref:Replicative DNA helicase n=1 Tax=Oceanicella actignis TaxID=1189325 RepID=A0A1M7RWB8_9RHOB|nr:replicative DNA helicase [Oceanicella actignis]SET01620.1 replicative DNA helicase [Oceanicella actignis]SHN50292.1 replicative DNA helicase [Oceanicella actignis]